MALKDVRRRLPVVDALPESRGRKHPPVGPGQRRPPTYAVWELTLACDLKCQACGPRAGRPRPDELSTEEALRLVEELAALGVGEVTLIGGEAYLRNDFILIIRAIRDAGMKSSMTTGGRGLTAARVEAMAEAGVELVSVSIDGLGPTHDRLRGVSGSFDRAMQALARCREAGIRVAANSQLNRANLGELEALLERLIAEQIVAWQTFLTIPHGNAADHPELVLQPYMLLELFDRLAPMIDRCAAAGVAFWPGNNLGYFGPYEEKIRRLQRAGGHYAGCLAGRTGLGIESDGAIKSCPSLGGPANTGGRWRETSLRQIWDEAPAMLYVSRRTVDDLWGYCRECYYAEVCMGGCTATSEPLLGQPGNNPYCHHRALEMDRRGLRERVEQVTAADSAPFAAGSFRVIREPVEPVARQAPGAITVDEPRPSRH